MCFVVLLPCPFCCCCCCCHSVDLSELCGRNNAFLLVWDLCTSLLLVYARIRLATSATTTITVTTKTMTETPKTIIITIISISIVSKLGNKCKDRSRSQLQCACAGFASHKSLPWKPFWFCTKFARTHAHYTRKRRIGTQIRVGETQSLRLVRVVLALASELSLFLE